MAILEQYFDPADLIARISHHILHSDSAIFRGDWRDALSRADDALADIHTYKQCRDEGMEEPSAPRAMWYLLAYPFHAQDIYSSADAWIGDAERDFREIADAATLGE